MTTVDDYLRSLEFGAPVTLDDVRQARDEIKAIAPDARLEIWHTISEVHVRLTLGQERRTLTYTVK